MHLDIYLFIIIIFCFTSFQLWQEHVQCVGGEQNKLWELQWSRIHQEYNKRRERCVSAHWAKALLLPQWSRLLLGWSQSCHFCSRNHADPGSGSGEKRLSVEYRQPDYGSSNGHSFNFFDMERALSMYTVLYVSSLGGYFSVVEH